MGPDINFNTNYFDFASGMPSVAGPLAQLGDSKRGQLGDFKLFARLALVASAMVKSFFWRILSAARAGFRRLMEPRGHSFGPGILPVGN